MLGLSASELGMILFIFVLIALAGKLPAWGEALGAFLYRRRHRHETGEQAPRGPRRF
jgi:Sec-independent protein translocase protein TatA